MRWDHCPTTAERSWLEPLAEMARPAFTPAPPEKITGVILALSAALPKQRTDEMRGETMLAVYQKQLRDLTVEEIEQAARKCLDELDWFPTIRQIKQRATADNGGRLPTTEQNYHNRIKAVLRRKPVSLHSSSDGQEIDPKTADILAGLKAKANTTRGAWSKTNDIN
ncbi:hypothetical protein [Sphingorhabdus sp. SMR4y]|uniref:hypothetical protein n=1 Tax=Sphingorhabdus sp. SMR4y TaxID=2584094 RepID=UPI000B5EA085|nr:hypothetical protein [Sphingorhabdus sp. SMR4y]ASK88481.1 hypothetical protein SPHFLASMR4Y_01734 [Sphingorhabdus sp. SMR4y]